MRRWRIILAVVLVPSSLLAAGCSSNNGVSQAKVACSNGDPALNDTGSAAKQNMASIVRPYETAQKSSAQAAAADPRWNTLNEAYGTLIAAWNDLEQATSPTTTTNNNNNNNNNIPSYDEAAVQAVHQQWDSRALAAQDTVRSECAVAKAS